MAVSVIQPNIILLVSDSIWEETTERSKFWEKRITEDKKSWNQRLN